MVQATISRNDISVDLQVEAEGARTTVIESVSKPEQDFKVISQEDARVSDQFAAVRSFNPITGYIDGPSAYEDALILAEDLVKPHSDGVPLTIDLSNLEGFGTYDVAVNNSNALKLTYPPGQRNWVQVQLNVTQVDAVDGGDQSTSITPSSTTSNDGGSVTISNPRSGQSVTIEHGLTVTRTVGRPNSKIRPDIDEVTLVDHTRTAEDVFEIGGRLVSDTARADSREFINLLSTPLAREGLELTFNNSLYGLGTYTVAPTGSEAGRRVINASEPGMVTLRNITLRTITV